MITAPLAAGQPVDFITDDELAKLFTGFRVSVTITIIIESCCAGDFVKGDADLLSAQNLAGNFYNFSHLAIMMTSPARLSSFGDFSRIGLINCLTKDGTRTQADFNRDKIVTAEELFTCSRARTDASVPEFVRGTGG